LTDSLDDLGLEMEEWDSMSLFAFNDSDSFNDEDWCAVKLMQLFHFHSQFGLLQHFK
jgi:hypothetical protein